MIKHLPETLDARLLGQFDFGAIEPLSDSPLEHCFCITPPVKEYLEDRHNILLGAKGAGKSSVFSQLVTGKLSFKKKKASEYRILAIDNELEYESLRSLLTVGMSSIIATPSVRALFLWETYILFRLCNEFCKRDDIEAEIKERLKQFCDLLAGAPDKPTLFQLLMQAKPEITFGIDASNPNILTPTFSIKPSGIASKKQHSTPHVQLVDLTQIKVTVNDIAKRLGLTIYILIDHLDDFVAQEDYKTQKLLLEGIIRVCKGYDAYSNIRLKIFLRTDLYERLDFSQLSGREKVDQRRIELAWREQDIQQLIAERLLYNLRKVYGITNIVAEIDRNTLYIRNQLDQPPQRSLLDKLSNALHKTQKPDDLYDKRYVHLRDEVYRELIESCFPTHIDHHDRSGTIAKMLIYSYFQSHFQLANGECTPRHIVLFLQKLQRTTFHYYKNNEDQAILSLKECRYHMFRPEHLLQAYIDFRQELPDVFRGSITHRPWQKLLEVFFQSKKRATSFTATRLKSMLNMEERECGDFVACLEHLRILQCRDRMVPFKQRTYDLPIVLQFIYKRK